MTTVCIIPARGGSKGIPGKNLIDFCGKPLLAWSVIQALKSEKVDEVFVTSDSEAILAEAEKHGASGIKRPAELSTDSASSESALEHALDFIRTNREYRPDLVVFLQATSPLRDPSDIDGAVRALEAAGADSLFSMALLDDFCVWRKSGEVLEGLTYDPHNRGRRQDREVFFLENGSIYVFRPEVLKKYGRRLSNDPAMFEMPFWKSYEIDKAEDIDICSYFFDKRLKAGLVDADPFSLSPADLDLCVYDFDGVMTDNRVLVMEDGREGVLASRADGLGLDYLRDQGPPQLILSTETNPVVKARAAKIKLEVINACQDKKKALADYCAANGYSLARTLYVGNDMNDYEVMSAVGWPMAPADAHPEIRAMARHVFTSKGGGGVIRELADLLLRK